MPFGSARRRRRSARRWASRSGPVQPSGRGALTRQVPRARRNRAVAGATELEGWAPAAFGARESERRQGWWPAVADSGCGRPRAPGVRRMASPQGLGTSAHRAVVRARGARGPRPRPHRPRRAVCATVVARHAVPLPCGVARSDYRCFSPPYQCLRISELSLFPVAARNRPLSRCLRSPVKMITIRFCFRYNEWEECTGSARRYRGQFGTTSDQVPGGAAKRGQRWHTHRHVGSVAALSRRSPSTRSSRTARPPAWSHRVATSNGCACLARMRPACSARS